MKKQTIIGILNNKTYTINIKILNEDKNLYLIKLNKQRYLVNVITIASQEVSILINNQHFNVYTNSNQLNNCISATIKNHLIELQILNQQELDIQQIHNKNLINKKSLQIHSPMSGKISRFLVTEGTKVKKDQGLLIIEAMKMENELQSPKNGIIKKIKTTIGATIKTSDVLIIID